MAMPRTIPLTSDPFDDMTTRRVVLLTIAPQEAARILAAFNKGNRRLSAEHVKHLAGELKAGRWMVNGETIVFSATGRLLDGQTRLAACAAASLPLTTYVAFGVDEDAFHTIDVGRRRSNADLLAMHGESNTSQLAAVLAMLNAEERGDLQHFINSGRFDVIEVLGRHPDIRPFISWGAGHRLDFRPQPRIVSFCYYRFAQKDLATADRFFADLESGANLTSGDPVLLLRNRLISDLAAKAKIGPVYQLALFLKAWNARRLGKKQRFLRWKNEGKNPEPFPEIL